MGDLFSLLNPFDWMAIVLLIYFTIQGAVRGFIREAIKVISLILSVAVAKMAAMPLTVFLYETFGVRKLLLHKLTVTIQQTYIDGAGGKSLEQLKHSLDLIMSKFSFLSNLVIEEVKQNREVLQVFKKGGQDFTASLANALVGSLEPVILYVLSIIVFIILIFVFKLLLGLISGVLTDIVESLPIMGGLNTLLGFGFGALKGVCMIVVIFSVLFLLMNIFPGSGIFQANTLLDSETFKFMGTVKDTVLTK